MIVYKDIITGHELFSDAFPMKVVDDIVYEVECSLVTVKGGADVDIGANPSAEEQEEALEDAAKQVVNVVHSFQLEQTSFTKKDYVAHIKAYMKAIKGKLEEKDDKDRLAIFQERAPKYVQKIVATISQYDFYVCSSFDLNGMIALLNYREDGTTPYLTYWMDGVVGEKQ